MGETCEMMLSAPGEDERSCGASPTVGGNGLYRYCERHMRLIGQALGTTLVRHAAELPTFGELLTATTEAIAPTGRAVTDRAREVLRLGDETLRRLIADSVL